MTFMCMCACIRACVYVFDTYCIGICTLIVYPQLLGRNYPKGLVGLHPRHLRGVGVLQHPPHCWNWLQNQGYQNQRKFGHHLISLSQTGIGWSISGLWFCTGCPSSSCKEIKLLIKKVCIVNETVNSCNEKKLLIENFEMIRTCWS